MNQIYWIDIADEQPEKDQWIFYLSAKVSEWFDKNDWCVPGTDDIDKGQYLKDNLVEWHYDYAGEEFKYCYPIPQMTKEKSQ